MKDKIESRTDKLASQPNKHDADNFLGNLNDELAKKIAQANDQDNDESPKVAAAITGEQQPRDVSLDDQAHEQLNSRVQQRVDAAINVLTDVQSDLANLAVSAVSHAVANGEEIRTGVFGTQAGFVIDNYNAVISAIHDLKCVHKLE